MWMSEDVYMLSISDYKPIFNLFFSLQCVFLLRLFVISDFYETQEIHSSITMTLISVSVILYIVNSLLTSIPNLLVIVFQTRTPVHSAASSSHRKPLWRCMWGFTLERSHSSARCAASVSRRRPPWSHTCSVCINRWTFELKKQWLLTFSGVISCWTFKFETQWLLL